LADMAEQEKASGRDEPVKIDLDPEEAVRALLAVDPNSINAEELAEKHGVQGLALRNMLRTHPDLTPGHQWHEHYRIDAEVEARIVAHPEFQGLPKR
jgi:hypothetical protein